MSICQSCRETRHSDCVGKDRCYCQHKVSKKSEPATGPAGE